MPVTILTVDDSSTIRMIVKKAFKPYDVEVIEASNGLEGLAVAAKEQPDLILLDYTMPLMNGYEMLAKLKSDEGLKGIPVIMLTAEAGKENVVKIAKIGVRNYLVKPFNQDVVVERVSRIIDIREKGKGPEKRRRFDDEIKLLLVEDRPAITEQIKEGLQDTKWILDECTSVGVALDKCGEFAPDVVCMSLALPDDSSTSFVRMLRSKSRSSRIPVIGMSVKTESEEQARALEIGCSTIILKPIDMTDFKFKVARTLRLDTSYMYFRTEGEIMYVEIPKKTSAQVVESISGFLKVKFSDAVHSGIDKVIVDIREIESVELSLLKLLVDVTDYGRKLQLKTCLVGAEALLSEWRSYEETHGWDWYSCVDEAKGVLLGEMEPAAV